ncbi:MAG: thiamine pyrophosphate-dependent enzyme [Pigmentiphaga sp.]
MIRDTVIQIVNRYRNAEPSVSGPGTISRLMYTTGHKAGSIYQMDMAYATSTALGLALARPDQRVIAVEGDGSIIAAMSVFSTIGRYQPANLVVVIIDNAVYASAGDGSVRTGTACGTDIAAIARACGVPPEQASTVETEAQAETAIQRAFTEPGPWVIVARVSDADKRVMQGAKSRGVIPFGLAEMANNLRRDLENRPSTPPS